MFLLSCVHITLTVLMQCWCSACSNVAHFYRTESIITPKTFLSGDEKKFSIAPNQSFPSFHLGQWRLAAIVVVPLQVLHFFFRYCVLSLTPYLYHFFGNTISLSSSYTPIVGLGQSSWGRTLGTRVNKIRAKSREKSVWSFNSRDYIQGQPYMF